MIIIFEKTIEKEDLTEIREKTGKIEEELSKNKKRTINIDPGYISETELVLATKKGKPWKESLGKGIFAHKVLEFGDNEVIAFNHTFADYRLDKNLKFLKKNK